MNENVKITVSRSAGPDNAVLVMIDTDFEPDAGDGGPGLRVLVNDGTVYEGKAYEPTEGEWRDAAPACTLSVDLSEITPVPETGTCRRCQRTIALIDGRWVDPEATGDDSVWRETCDANHDDRIAAHEPYEVDGADAHGNALDIAQKDAEDDGWRLATEAEVADHVGEWGLSGLEHRTEGDTLLVRPVGPRTYTSTITPEAAAALAESTPVFTEAAIVVDSYAHPTGLGTAESLLDWLIQDATQSGESVSVDVKDSHGGTHAFDLHPRQSLRTLLVREAAGLLDVDEVHDNPEYLRALVELTCRTLGLGTEGNREDIEAAIEAEVRSQNAGLLSERATRQARGDVGYEG